MARDSAYAENGPSTSPPPRNGASLETTTFSSASWSCTPNQVIAPAATRVAPATITMIDRVRSGPVPGTDGSTAETAAGSAAGGLAASGMSDTRAPTRAAVRGMEAMLRGGAETALKRATARPDLGGIRISRADRSICAGR
jgi:hypothetical protein